MKTYDHQKYFPKVLRKNFTSTARVKFLNSLTDEYYNPRKIRLTKIFSLGTNFRGSIFLGALFPGAFFRGAFFLGAFFREPIFLLKITS